MTSDRTILITGVTGESGRRVAQALQGTGFRLRGLTRTPDSERAAALARHGVDIVKGDLDDEATLRRALAGAVGRLRRAEHVGGGRRGGRGAGQASCDVGGEAGVEHYVYTSVGSAHKQTGIPHFDNKWRIEETVRGLRFPRMSSCVGVLHGEPAGALQSPGSHAGLGARARHEAPDDLRWTTSAGSAPARSTGRRRLEPPRDRSRR